MELRPTLAALAFAVLTACTPDPSVQSLTEENRADLEAFIGRVRGVREQLASAPTEATGVAAGTLTLDNTVVVHEADFDALRTDRQQGRADHYDWRNTSTARAYSSSDLAELVDQVRAEPMNPPERLPHQLEAMQRRLSWMRTVRYVAVVITEHAVGATGSGGSFTHAEWRARLAIWDLQTSAWIGAIPVEVRDTRTHARVGSTRASDDLNYQFNAAINTAVSRAITSGQAVHATR